MKTAYVAIDIKTDDFLNGLNPTTQPGVKLPYFGTKEAAMYQAQIFSRGSPEPYACFVAAVGVPEVCHGKLDTLNPSAVYALSMAVCKQNEMPNQNNTVTFFTKKQSMQEICDTAREIVTLVREGMSVKQAVEIAVDHTPSFRIPTEYTAGYGIQEPKPKGSSGDTPVIISEHHLSEGTEPQTFISEYAAKQFEFLPDALYQQAMSAFNDKMNAYAQASTLYANREGYEAAAVTYAMQAIAENVTMKHPDVSRQAYDTMCAAQELASKHGVDWSEMEYRPEADHSKYLAEHCQGMTAGMAAAVATKYHAFFRESNAYTLPEQQALALHAAVSDIANHQSRYVASGEMRGNDHKLLEDLRDNMSQELADRNIRPGALLDDIGDDTVGDDAK